MESAEELRAEVARLRAQADRLAATVALVMYDAHPVFGSTAKWGGGIGGSALTAHCSLTQGAPPGDEWAEYDLPSQALREYLADRGDFDLESAKGSMKAELRAMLGGTR